ncbi:MAG: DUF4956 domain-containing protein [Clostridia bacterium]|nr:DUF4956 domain-containing protein [Clostridia bacterium]
MKQELFELLKNQGDLTWQQISVNIGMSIVLGLVIYISYIITHQGTIYSKKFNVTLVALTVLTTTVMTVIGNNIALSLGMVGALSIVRFRTAIKDSRDTAYIFWTVITGICCGVQNYFVAAIGSAGVFLVFLILGTVKSDSRMLVIVRGSRSVESSVEALVYKAFNRRAIMRVKNTTPDTIEFIYECSSKVLRNAQRDNPNLINSFYSLGDVEYVNFVMQNDEIVS